MPTYEYECTVCGHRFEQRQGMTDAPLSVCPVCGKEVRRIISGGGGILFGQADERGRGNTACSLQQTGSTCCGRQERCDKPPCGN
ncbi:zinc ribbon domain-containing protein [Candidatus Fermentibacteria bacterium]|nr:zinc ribbon domain-containing protein [Candidatus Fermentibacteria bacterium]